MDIRVDLKNVSIADGSEVVFRSPADCSQVTGMVVYHADGKTEFSFADAHGNNVGDIDHLFAENAVVKVILDVSAGMAFVQNADTNAYIEGTFVKSVNGKKPDKLGNVEVPVAGATHEQIVAAVEDYLSKNPVSGGVDAEQLTQAVEAALADAVKSGRVAPAIHGHSYNDLEDKPIIPVSLPANGGNADTVGGKTAEQIQQAAADGVSAAVNTALRDAKASGLFDGRNGEPGKTPEKGVDYFTEADKAEIVQAVLDALGGVPVFGVVDANNVIVLSGALAEGVYTLKYEAEDGKVTEIGTLNHTNAPEVTYTNLFDAGKATLNTRMSGSSSTSKAQDGYVMTAEIQLPAPVTVTGTYDETVPFVLVPDAMWASSANIFGRVANGDLNMFMDAGSTPGTTVGAWRKIHLRNQFSAGTVTVSSIIVSLYVKGSSVSATDIQGIEIYYNEIPE